MPDASGLLKQTYGDDEDSSEEWKKIKGWVGAHEPAKKHPIHQLIEREQRKTPGYAEGGAAGAPLGVHAPIDISTIPPPAAPLAPDLVQKALNTAPAPTPTPIAAPTEASYQSKAAQTLGTSPDELKAFLTKTMTPTGGEMIGRAGSSIATGLSAAGGSNQDYLGKFNEQAQREKENLSGIPGKVSAAGKEQFGLAHEMQTLDASSPYSKVWQRSHTPELISLGVPKNYIPFIPAEIGDKMLTGQIELKKALAEIANTAEFRKESLLNQRMELTQTASHERAEEESAKTGHEEEAAKALLGRGPLDKLAGMNPWSATGKATRVLADEMKPKTGHGIPDLGDTFNGQKVIGVKRIK